MNQVLEFLAENYIYVAGGSLGIIIILIIIIAIGNKKNKNKMSENVSANDMAAIAPQPITGVEPVQEPSLEAVPPVSTTPVETVANVAEGVFSNPSASVEPAKVVEQPTPVVETPVAPEMSVASAPVQEVFSSVNAPSTEPVTEAPFIVPSVGESAPSVEPVVQPMPEAVAPVEAVASAPVQEVFSPVNAPVSEPVVEAPVPEMPVASEPTAQFDMADVNTTTEVKKDTSDLEVFNIE